jgi:2'-5' RNA ligase
VARIFVAIPIPLDVARPLAAIVPQGLGGLRHVEPEFLHVTLAFVGSIDEPRVADVVAAVEAAAGGQERFRIELAGVGRFPPTGRTRFIWAGAAGSAERIEGVGDRVRSELARRGLPFDPKPLRAHVTLARMREGATAEEARAVAAAVAAARVPAGLGSIADEVHVVESTLSPRGPRYSSRARVPLQG